MSTPFLTIIIPTFNSAKTLTRCLDSVINQRYRDYEIVIVDGQSTDGTLGIIDDYATSYPSIVYTSQKDNGIYDAMNKGIEKARGTWLYFLGSDDALYDDRVLEKISSKLTSEAVMVYGRAFVTPDNTITDINFTFEKLMRWNICHQAIFYSKEIFTRWKYDTRYPTLADWDLNFKIFAAYAARIRCYDVIVCTFNNAGKSADWLQQAEYKNGFSSPLRLFLRYIKFPQSLYWIRNYYRDNGLKNLLQLDRSR